MVKTIDITQSYNFVHTAFCILLCIGNVYIVMFVFIIEIQKVGLTYPVCITVKE